MVLVLLGKKKLNKIKKIYYKIRSSSYSKKITNSHHNKINKNNKNKLKKKKNKQC